MYSESHGVLWVVWHQNVRHRSFGCCGVAGWGFHGSVFFWQSNWDQRCLKVLPMPWDLCYVPHLEVNAAYISVAAVTQSDTAETNRKEAAQSPVVREYISP